ncbi:MAG TPA: glycosyltransferase WbuB [Candidatus Binatia bacterium]|nr:glycosyltransferase WbuB [Candidatus Binatia bacterium]
MRFLVLGINYAPELTGIGKYTSEMAEWLIARGHDVQVVTAPPYYPAWRVGEGYSAWRYRREMVAGVHVWRCPLWVPLEQPGLKRVLHLASFALSTLPVVLWQGLRWRPDVVWVVEPAFFSTLGAWLAARLGNAKAWLHVQDFEIDVAFDLELLPISWLRRGVTAFERWIMHRFDRVSTISERMLEQLAGKGVDAPRRFFFPNWVDAEKIYPLPDPNPLRAELLIAPDTIVALHAGNMGEKQGLEIVVEVARALGNHHYLQFILCGDGAARKRLLQLADGLPNVRFLPVQPAERLNELLNLADIHLLPQRADSVDRVMPSKLTGMLASGRPVVATAHPCTQVAQVVAGRGIVTPPGDAVALTKAILHLATRPAERAQLGQAARAFALAHWSREEILRRFEEEIGRLG